MDKTIKADLYRYGGLTGIKGFLIGMRIPGFRYTYILRKTSKYKRYSFRGFFFMLLKQRYMYKYGFQIPPETQIGDGFYIGHFGNIVVNGEARIGKNCNLNHCTTIGQVSSGKRQGSPTIGDNVWIGTGSVVVGNIHIGNNVLIAPCSFVNFDVPDNSMVIGNQAKIIPKENPTEGVIHFTI